MAAFAHDGGSMVLVEEYFANEDPRFEEALRKVHQPKSLAAFADRWKKDPRPWAHQQILSYLAAPLNCPGHQPVVKRLFKHAESTEDSAVMAVFLVAFDRQVRRQIRTKWRWDARSRQAFEEERLVTPRDVLHGTKEAPCRNPATGELMAYSRRQGPADRLFTYRTRYYLRRRAWRYFRRLGHRHPGQYPAAVAAALARYPDADLGRGENILDSWGLLHACFARHEALKFGATHVALEAGRSLNDLAPAPAFADLWRKPESAPLLFGLAWRAQARLVRLWAMQLLEAEHAAYAVPLEQLSCLLDHEDAEVQQFGARWLEHSPSLATLPVASWLRLLETRNHDALQLIADAFLKHVAPERLSLAQCLELANRQPAPVARLGQRFLQTRAITAPEDCRALAGLAEARCPAAAGELAGWALGILGRRENYQTDLILPFFDSTSRTVREASWGWLAADATAATDPVLWSRLVETPYDDVRLRLVDHLQRQMTPAAGALKLDDVWRSVLLGVHCGGRQKAKAVRQIAQAILAEPARAETLLPVLAAAVRSVRGPEARAGLAAVVGAAEARPELAEAVRRFLPELKLEVPA
jgi:hypothetical protein